MNCSASATLWTRWSRRMTLIGVFYSQGFPSTNRGGAMASTIESVLQEKRVFPPSPQFVKQANISGMEAYRKLIASYNCLDRHLKTQPDKVAIIFEADDGRVTTITYQQLYKEVCKLANALKAHGVKKGDRVLIYMPMSIQVVTAMQAC